MPSQSAVSNRLVIVASGARTSGTVSASSHPRPWAAPLWRWTMTRPSPASRAMAIGSVVSVLVSQVIHLPAPSRDELRRSQRDYVAEWVALLTAARPGLPAPEARVLVHAALALINGLTRVPHLAVQSGARARIAALAEAVLAAEG